MKRTKSASKKANSSVPSKNKVECEHANVYAVATFVDENAREAFLLQTCEHCGENFLLMGQYPLTICG